MPHLAPHCERVVRADLNDAGWVNQVGVQEKFDTIVVADVLEHLTAPQEVLRACSSLLSPDGSVVISLPHIGHAVIYACLMDDNFDYREHGLLDSTHIRFFGLKNMQALIEGAGFKVVDVGFVCRAPEDTEYADQWRRAPPDLKAAILKNPHSNIYQCVMRVVRACAPGEPLDLMAQPSHVPRVTFLMLLNRVLKRVLPVTLYRFIRKVYEIISWITSKR